MASLPHHLTASLEPQQAHVYPEASPCSPQCVLLAQPLSDMDGLQLVHQGVQDLYQVVFKYW